MHSRSSIIIFSMVVGMSISTNAETVKVMDKASTDGSFTIAQTSGMNRRGDRRDNRQDCRQAEGASARTSATANSKDARISRGTAARGIRVWRFAIHLGLGEGLRIDPTSSLVRVIWVSASGQEGQFPPPSLSGRCGFPSGQLASIQWVDERVGCV